MRFVSILLLSTIAMLPLSTLGNDDSAWISSSQGPSLPNETGLGGAYAGVDNGVLIVAGGSNFPDKNGPKTFHDAIYVLEKNDGHEHWREVGRLPRPLAHGAAISTPLGLLCLGGIDSDGPRSEMFFLKWDAEAAKLSIQSLPVKLSRARSNLSAAFLDGRVYIAGGSEGSGESDQFEVIDLPAAAGETVWSRWQTLDSWPGPPRFGASLIVQNNGARDCLYLFGGKSGSNYLTDGYRYDPAGAVWKKTMTMPRAALLAPTVAAGQSHILVMSGSDGHDPENFDSSTYAFVTDILSYHTITDTWSTVGHLPIGFAASTAVPWQGGWLIPGGEIRPKTRTPEVLYLQISPPAGKFGKIDIAALCVYLGGLLGIGLFFSKREKTTKEFFLGSKQIPWWAVGLSLMATQVSSIGFMAIPAKSFATDWAYYAGVLTWFLVVPIVAIWFIPLFQKLNITTAYEYLEQRFDIRVRTFATSVFSLMQLGRMAVVLYLPAAALSIVTGLSAQESILIMGVLATAYTVAGGMAAVIWTDVIQAIVLFAGALFCIWSVISGIEGGAAGFAQIAMSDDKLQVANLNGGFTSAALWVVLVGGVFSRLTGLTSDQAVVQRYLTTKDAKQATRALWLDTMVSIPWATIAFGLGTALYVFYKTRPELITPGLKTIEIVPIFISQQVPSGLKGIIIAAIFAAAMSSLDSSMHSIATTWTTDFYSRFRRTASDFSKLRFAKILTLLLGMFGTAAALWLASADVKSLWDFFIKTVGLFGGGLGGIFLLALFTRTSANGALVGILCSVGVMIAVWSQGLVHPLLYTAVGVVSCVGAGCLAGRINVSPQNLK